MTTAKSPHIIRPVGSRVHRSGLILTQVIGSGSATLWRMANMTTFLSKKNP